MGVHLIHQPMTNLTQFNPTRRLRLVFCVLIGWVTFKGGLGHVKGLQSLQVLHQFFFFLNNFERTKRINNITYKKIWKSPFFFFFKFDRRPHFLYYFRPHNSHGRPWLGSNFSYLFILKLELGWFCVGKISTRLTLSKSSY